MQTGYRSGKSMKKFVLVALLLSIAGWVASPLAHMTPGSLKINNGSTSLTGGTTAAVKWNTSITHNSTYKIAFSKDNGATWTPVTTITGQDGSTGEKTYTWTVPTEATTQGKLRVNQSAQGEKANSPDNDYNIFATFSIASTTAITPRPTTDFTASQAALTPSLTREGDFVAVRFVAADARQASVEVYDLSGALQKTVELTSVKSGANLLRLSTQQLGLTSKSVLRLRVGNQVLLEELVPGK
jgi:hypothetical protein